MGRLQTVSVAFLGIPLDENSSYLRGPALAPGRIREALHIGSANLCTEGFEGFDPAGERGQCIILVKSWGEGRIAGTQNVKIAIDDAVLQIEVRA